MRIVRSIGVAIAAGAIVPAQAEEALNWTPETYAQLEQTIIASADAEGEPIHGLTVGPGDFLEKIDAGYVSYLASTRHPANLAGATDQVHEAFVRTEYFRDQTVMIGSSVDGTRREATFRSVQMAFAVDCASRMLASNGLTQFQRNNTDGRAVNYFEGTTEFAKLQLSTPPEGSTNASLVRAVCDGKYVYEPTG